MALMQELSSFRRIARLSAFLCFASYLVVCTGCGFEGGGMAPASADTRVSSSASGPILISSGGTYSGNWTSRNPNVPAITIVTDEPVIIRNSTVSGSGTLISIAGTAEEPANVIIENVTGTALAGFVGRQRGRFVSAAHVAVLQVTHCTMTGVSFGVYLADSTITSLSISNNSVSNMEDRASNGHGGLTTERPSLGHYVLLNGVDAPNGAEIAWNQVIDTPGEASVEDIVNIFLSRGGSDNQPIRIHDNYLQGAFSTGAASYTGGGIITDGASDSLQTATGFVQIENNQVVHTANYGVSIDAGHDVMASNNRVVSCGKNAAGAWIAMNYSQAAILWNDFKSSQFFNNSISGTAGGLVRPGTSGNPMVADLWDPGVSEGPNNTVSDNAFTDPCIAEDDNSLEPEYAEKALWETKLASASQTVGSPPL
jgi:hypothetical protein